MELYSTLIFYNIVFAVEQETLSSRKCFESAKWRAQGALSLLNGVPNVLTCPTCPRAQVYFTERKIKKLKFCTHSFLKVLSLILDLILETRINFSHMQQSYLCQKN